MSIKYIDTGRIKDEIDTDLVAQNVIRCVKYEKKEIVLTRKEIWSEDFYIYGDNPYNDNPKSETSSYSSLLSKNKYQPVFENKGSTIDSTPYDIEYNYIYFQITFTSSDIWKYKDNIRIKIELDYWSGDVDSDQPDKQDSYLSLGNVLIPPSMSGGLYQYDTVDKMYQHIIGDGSLLYPGIFKGSLAMRGTHYVGVVQNEYETTLGIVLLKYYHYISTFANKDFAHLYKLKLYCDCVEIVSSQVSLGDTNPASNVIYTIPDSLYLEEHTEKKDMPIAEYIAKSLLESYKHGKQVIRLSVVVNAVADIFRVGDIVIVLDDTKANINTADAAAVNRHSIARCADGTAKHFKIVSAEFNFNGAYSQALRMIETKES
jgi:hypothetical protein